MKKKYYYRLSPVYLFFHVFLIFVLIVAVYNAITLTHALLTVVTDDDPTVIIIVTIIFYLGIPMTIHGELTLLIGNVQLNSQGICIRSDLKHGNEKLQYPTSINYPDIAEVTVKALKRNSKGQFVPISRPVPYLVILDKKGKKYRFGLYSMTKRAVRRLLVDLLDMCQKSNNDVHFDIEKLVKDFSAARFAVIEKENED